MKMRFFSIATVSMISVLSACTTLDEVREYRAKNCPATSFNPQGLKIGDFVKILVSGTKGQVVQTADYSYSEDYAVKYTLEQGSFCVTNFFEVRVDTHGIAARGLFDSARPEVLPILQFKFFEIEPLK